MTRKSKREVERAVEDLVGRQGPAGHTEVVFEDPETGEWFDGRSEDANLADEDDLADAAPLVVVREEVVETGWVEE